MEIKKYKDFLLEYEGGPPAKDPIKVSSNMITNIELEEEEDKDGELDILQDFKNIEESINELDPYGEENWEEPVYDYSSWKGDIYDFLKQLNNNHINNTLRLIEGMDKNSAENYLSDIEWWLLEEMGFNQDNILRISKDLPELLDFLCIKDYDDGDEDEGPDPDEYHDRKMMRDLD